MSKRIVYIYISINTHILYLLYSMFELLEWVVIHILSHRLFISLYFAAGGCYQIFA
jgi:hypothetical protein